MGHHTSDGAHSAELLLTRADIIDVIKRRPSSFNTVRIDHIYLDPHVADAHFQIHYGNVTASTNLVRIIQAVQPDENYNLPALGAMST